MPPDADAGDAELATAARAGSQIAFARIVDRHQQAVRAFLRRVAADREEADDLAQETFIAAWRHLPSWRGEASLRSWLFAIAWKKAANGRRALFRRLARDTGFAEKTELERPGDGGSEDRLALASAIADLPLAQRAAAALCLAEDYSHSEAAEILGLPLGTLKSHVARARAKLLSALEMRP
jgi:RNA polymerase sigma-70 factor (ECF subfamily)